VLKFREKSQNSPLLVEFCVLIQIDIIFIAV